MSESKQNADTTRRSFLKGGAIAAGATASGLAAPAVLAQSPIVIKMQTSWPAADIWMDFAQQYVDRVEAMSGGRLKVDLLPSGAVVAAGAIDAGSVAFGQLDTFGDGAAQQRGSFGEIAFRHWSESCWMVMPGETPKLRSTPFDLA